MTSIASSRFGFSAQRGGLARSRPDLQPQPKPGVSLRPGETLDPVRAPPPAPGDDPRPPGTRPALSTSAHAPLPFLAKQY